MRGWENLKEVGDLGYFIAQFTLSASAIKGLPVDVQSEIEFVGSYKP